MYRNSPTSSLDALHILVADDHPVFRTGLRLILKELRFISTISEVSSAKDCIYRLERTSFDLVVFDISLPDMDGLEMLKTIRDNWPEQDVLVLSPYNELHLLTEVNELGARAFLLKTASTFEIVDAFSKVASGSEFVTAPSTLKRATPDISLTRREMEVLKLLCLQMSSKEIAEKLFLSKHTIDNHRKRILNKTSQRNTLALVNWAIQNKVVDSKFLSHLRKKRKKS